MKNGENPITITQDERAKYRQVLTQLTTLMEPLHEYRKRGTLPPPAVAAMLTEMTKSSDPVQQLAALEALYADVNRQYDEELRYAAQYRYSPFCEYMFRNEVPVKHQEFLIDHMEMIHHGEIKRLAISMPPGSAKTSFASVRFAAWHLGRRPSDRWVQGAHTMQFAKDRLGKPVRSLITENRYSEVFPEMRLSASSSAADYFEFAGQAGYYKAVGVGTGIAGYRFEIGAIDDPLASREDAESPSTRRKLHEWYDDDFGTRPSNPDAPIFIVNCLTGDTKISMSDGSWKYMIDVKVGDSVVTYKNGALSSDVVTMWANQGPDDIIAIKTGQTTIRGNARHPLLVENADGSRDWKKMGDIVKGDKLVASGATETNLSSELTEEQAWALGFILGDGWITVNNKRNYDKVRNKYYPATSWVTCVATKPKRPEQHTKCIKILSDWFGATFRETKFGYWRSEKATLGRYLHNIGMGVGAKNKRIPLVIYNSTVSVRKAYLDGMAAADGHRVNKGEYTAQSIGVSNNLLIEDLRHLAVSIGIKHTNKHEREFLSQPPFGKGDVTHGYTCSFRYHPDKLLNLVPYTTTVVSVTKETSRENVYDISVGNDATFIASGIVSHNTRWHEDDLTGHELQKMREGRGDDWTVINVPAIALENDPIGRPVGEGLWPEIFGTDFYLKKKRTLTGRSWNSLYQGNPVDEEGGVLRRGDVQRYTNVPKDEVREGKITKKVIRRVTLSVDCAEKATQRSDFTAATVWLETTDKKHYLIHASRIKKEFVEMVQWIEELARQYNVDTILVEDRGAGTQYIQVRRLTPGPAPVVAISTNQQSKVFRFDGVTPMFASGAVQLPEAGTDWLADVEAEIFAFPSGKHDDYVDTISQYLTQVRDGSGQRRGLRKLRGSSHA